MVPQCLHMPPYYQQGIHDCPIATPTLSITDYTFNFHKPYAIYYFTFCCLSHLFPGGSDAKESTCSTQETQVWSLSWEDPLEKEMATHSSIPVWRIPWTEEPGGQTAMGSLTSEEKPSGDFPGGQWLRIPLAMQGMWTRSPVRELRPHTPHSKPVCCNYWVCAPQLESMHYSGRTMRLTPDTVR